MSHFLLIQPMKSDQSNFASGISRGLTYCQNVGTTRARTSGGKSSSQVFDMDASHG